MNPEISSLRRWGLLEGSSYLLLLFVAMPLKYQFDLPLAVRIIGSLHGLLFVVYILIGAKVGLSRGWPPLRMIQLLVAAILPFGPFWFDRFLKTEGVRR
jgi:integral membrane protein